MAEVESEAEGIEESFLGDVKRLGNWVREKKYVILIVCLWTALLSFVIVWEYYDLYASTPILMDPSYRVAFAPTNSMYIPRLNNLDYLVILVASVLAGYAIADIEETLFGFLVSGILSTLIGVAYSTLFILYVLGSSPVLSYSVFTNVLWVAFLNIFRMVFPIALMIVFMGSIFGSLFRGVFQPSAQD